MRSKRWLLLLLSLLLLSSSQTAWAQLQATLSSTTLGANVCGPRTITATVSGGSGDYNYFWNSRPRSTANLGAESSITVEPTVNTTYMVAVYDNVTGAYSPPASVSVYPAVNGEFQLTIPNAFTPNGDGTNDRWEVRGQYSSNTPINANRWHLEIYPSNGRLFYQSDYTDTNPGPGVIGGQIYWDGHGAVDGTYYYYLTLYNCTYPNGQTVSGQVNIFGPVTAVVNPTMEETAVYPNPVANELIVSPAQLLRGNAGNNSTLVAQKSVGTKSIVQAYEIKVVDKFNRIQRSVTSKDPQLKIDVSSLPEGTYFLQVSQGKETTRKQIVVTH